MRLILTPNANHRREKCANVGHVGASGEACKCTKQAQQVFAALFRKCCSGGNDTLNLAVENEFSQFNKTTGILLNFQRIYSKVLR